MPLSPAMPPTSSLLESLTGSGTPPRCTVSTFPGARAPRPGRLQRLSRTKSAGLTPRSFRLDAGTSYTDSPVVPRKNLYATTARGARAQERSTLCSGGGVPLPVRDSSSDELEALLAKEALAVAVPLACGLKVTVNSELWPAARLKGNEIPLRQIPKCLASQKRRSARASGAQRGA